MTVGRLTAYQLSVFDERGCVPPVDVMKDIWLISVSERGKALRDVAGVAAARCKWYGYVYDLAQIAFLYPTLIFQLDGEGEDPGDRWRKWWHGDKYGEWHAHIYPPAYDPAYMR